MLTPKHSSQPTTEHKLITFAIFAYNQQAFIREAILGAFSQSYSPLEIILSDDSSTDNTFEIMKEMATEYTGPHRIIVSQNEYNMGTCGHINNISRISSGELIVFAAGDDISLPDRTKILCDLWEKAGSPICGIHSPAYILSSIPSINNKIMDGAAVSFDRKDWRWFVKNNLSGIHGATPAYHRALFELFPPLQEVGLMEDKALAFRALLAGQLLYTKEPLVKYRIHDNSFCSKKTKSNKNKYRHHVANQILSTHQCLSDYIYFCKQNNQTLEPYIINKFTQIASGYAKSIQIDSRNPLKIAIAINSNPNLVSISDKINFFFIYFEKQDWVSYRILKKVKKLTKLSGFSKK